jgi:TonB-dependent starch-binding outer membrane protein SusC
MKKNYLFSESLKNLQVRPVKRNAPSQLSKLNFWKGKFLFSPFINNRILYKSIMAVLLLLLLPFMNVFAQTKTVTGTVTDDKNMPLPKVSVVVKNSIIGTSTDDAGKYSIVVPDRGDLVFSIVGFGKQEFSVRGKSVVDVQMTSSAESLNQVVVVTYGTAKKRDITGSVTAINASAVKDVPASEFGQKLQGKVAGLQVTMATGRPGQGMDFRIRGAASLSSGYQPLIVVDGQPLSGADTRNGDVNLINPDEIETFTVLKDASATALYGSRAANGVIIITTKQGKSGRTNLSLNAYNGWQTVPQKGRPDLMNAHEFATFMKGFYEDKATYEGYTGGIPADYANPDQYGKGTNWYDAILRTAPMQNYSLNLSSGTDKLSSSTTLTYFNQQGVLLNTGMERYSLRSNNEYRPNDHIKAGLNLAPMYQIDHNNRAGTDGQRQVIGMATSASPLIPIRDANGNWNYKASSAGMLGISNPVQQLLNIDGNQNSMRMLANLYGEVEILNNLRFRSSINADFGTAEYNAFYNSYYGPNLNPPTLPRPATQNSSSHSSYTYISWLNENTLTYSLKKGDHDVDFLAGYSAQKWGRNYRSINGSNYAGDAIPWIAGAAVTSGSNNREEWSLASAFGRINYNFRNKYFITGTFRQDGSSRFGENKKYGYFPSVSAGWVLSDEKFFPKSDAVSFLKLRGSYGKTGNFNIGNYLQISNITSTNYVFGGVLTPGVSITSLGNKDLTWEISKQADFGLDINFLNNRLTFTYDYYNKTTEGMLYPTSLPVASGYSSVTLNVGKFRMWGHEFQLSSRNLEGKLSWSTDFNISFNDNKVLALPPNTPFIGGGPTYSGFNRSVVGSRIGEFYGYIFQGIYENDADLTKYPKYATSALGSARMKDVNGDGVIDANDRTLIGNPNPDFIYGMTNTLNYKNFDFNVIIAGQVGNKIMNVGLQDMHNNDGVFNMTTDMINRWRSPTSVGDGVTPGTRSGSTELYRLANTTWLSPGDYLTVKNIALGYTFNLSKLKYIKTARIYASVQQAFVFTKYKGQNPEASYSRDNAIGIYGQDLSTFPVPRTIMIGGNFNF